MRTHTTLWTGVAQVVVAGLLLASCVPPPPRTTVTRPVPATYDPAVWGRVYPREYLDWQATKDARPVGTSKYKRGGAGGREYDRLSEYPYMSALTSGSGLAVEYNEPRGHQWMLVDQNAVDPARLTAGGACLSCKTPYAPELRAQEGTSFFSMPYQQAAALLPPQDRFLGVTCIDCHEPSTLRLRPRSFLVTPALETMGTRLATDDEARNLVCGQCHSTYVIPNQDGRSLGVVLPWEGSTPGSITVENVIAYIRRHEPASLEWTQQLTGFRLGYIRHPEYEMFTAGSPHWRAGVTCPDCHMPYRVKGASKVADHAVGDPLDDPALTACQRCHPQPAEQLRRMVYDIQDRVVGLTLLSGYSVAQDARLFQLLNSKSASASVDGTTYAAAKEAYIQAFYRAAYLSAENSVGFHNPAEASRIAGDCLAYSQRAEALLRQALAGIGSPQPPEADLQLRLFLTDRGVHHAGFDPRLEFRDPSGVTERLFPANLAALRSDTPFALSVPPGGGAFGADVPSATAPP